MFPYNMNMKNTKAIFFIVLGSFILATGFAFAGNNSYDQAGNPGLWKADGRETIALPKLDITTPAGTSKTAEFTAPVTKAAPAGVPTIKADPPPPPKPLKEKVKEFIGEHAQQIMAGGIGAYLGFALFGGPVGMLIGALFFLGLIYMNS